MHRIHGLALAALLTIGFAVPAAAQTTNVTQADIQRLQDNIYQATTDLQQLRGRDATQAATLQTQLDDLRDEVVYLKVKLRKEGRVTRVEYADARDQIEDLRSRARNDTAGRFGTPAGSTATNNGRDTGRGGVRAGATREVPTGTELDVRLQSELNSDDAMVEDRFDATTIADVIVDGRVLIPVGSVMRGVVTAVESAGRINRTAKMTVSFDQVTIQGRAYPMRGTVTQAIESGVSKGDIGKIGAGAGIGAIIGGILGGGKGALAGILIGGGGTIAATEGTDVNLPQGSVLRVRIDSPLTVGAALR